MHHTALLQNPTFQLDYSPSSSESDCIGPQRAFSASAAFPTDDEDQHRQVGSLGHSLSQPAATTVTNGFRYNSQHSTLQDVHFAPPPGLFVSPLDSCSGVSSSSPISSSSLHYAPIFPNDVTSTESILSTPASVYSNPVPSHWNDRMSDFRSPRIPALHPSASLSTSLQPQGTTMPSSSSMVGRDNYPTAYTLSRSSFPSQVSGINELSRYSQYSSIPPVLGNQVEPSSTVYPHHGSLLLEPHHRTGQPAADAPPFHDTVLIHTIVANNQAIKPEIQAKIHKGFFQVDEKWTCYRRNYFSVSCSFSLRPWTPNDPLYLHLPNHAPQRIHSFAMSISAVVNAQDGEVRELVQHTPKRDKQSEKKPEKVTLQPQQSLPLGSNVGPAGVANHHAFGVHSHSGGMAMDYNHPFANALQSSHPPTQHTFERIQFQKATANNGKRRAQQQYYNLVVELHAKVSHPVSSGVGSQWIRVAKRLSDSMVVRGRSPGHYKDGRRDSSASMGPDSGGTGSSGDGSRGTMLPPGIGQAPFSHLPLMSYDASQRGGSHYNRNAPQQQHQRPLASIDQSPSSTSTFVSSSSSSSSPFEFNIFSDSMDGVESVEDASQVSSYHDVAFDLGSSNRKKSMSTGSRQSQLSSVEFSSHSEERDGTENTFDETFESVVPGYHGDQEDTSQYLKPSPSLGNVSRHHPAETGLDNGRPSRFDPIQSPRSLCT
ncbi:hypothetical protein VTN77DRAFT_3552 [Rasamsonia byssochlamydoides]|uniref:uncharacterized protein n=1 Tax=Rasamsonia byssochlamydoides TaxID=89139 RepID=UPI003742200A